MPRGWDLVGSHGGRHTDAIFMLAFFSQPYPAVTVASSSKARRWRSTGTEITKTLVLKLPSQSCIIYPLVLLSSFCIVGRM